MRIRFWHNRMPQGPFLGCKKELTSFGEQLITIWAGGLILAILRGIDG